MSDEEFESSDVGDSKIYPQEASTIRKNSYIVIKGRPCRVLDVLTSETGECHFVAVDIFTCEKLEETVPSSHNCDVPRVKCTEYTFLCILDEGFVCVLTENGTTKDELKLPIDEALLTQLKDAFEEYKNIVVSVMSAMGEEKIIAVKEDGTKGGD